MWPRLKVYAPASRFRSKSDAFLPQRSRLEVDPPTLNQAVNPSQVCSSFLHSTWIHLELTGTEIIDHLFEVLGLKLDTVAASAVLLSWLCCYILRSSFSQSDGNNERAYSHYYSPFIYFLNSLCSAYSVFIAIPFLVILILKPWKIELKSILTSNLVNVIYFIDIVFWNLEGFWSCFEQHA